MVPQPWSIELKVKRNLYDDSSKGKLEEMESSKKLQWKSRHTMVWVTSQMDKSDKSSRLPSTTLDRCELSCEAEMKLGAMTIYDAWRFKRVIDLKQVLADSVRNWKATPQL